jgi:hypothetical protein
VSTATSARYSGIDGRRSTRIDYPVTLIVLGKNGLGQPFQEKTASTSVNLHGCRYPSRHEYPVGSWIGLQVLQPDGSAHSPLMRAQVRSIHTPGSPRELFQIGVELETPSNVWGILTPPSDWLRLTEGKGSRMHIASGGTLPRDPAEASQPSGVMHEMPHATHTLPPAPQIVPAPSQSAEAGKQAAPKTERFVITSDQLILSVRPKLQQAAEQAMQSAITVRLDEAVRNALCRIDDVQRANQRQTAEASVQRFEPLMRSSEEAILNRLEARLAEVRGQWQEQQDAQRRHMEEMTAGLEKMVADTRKELDESQKSAEKTGHTITANGGMESASFESKIQARLDECVKRAAQEFETAATRVSDRHLIRMMEDKQMVAREASAQLDARAAEARAVLHGAAGDAVQEFRRQLQAQMDMMMSEATQRASSSLASLDAESRSVYETRRRTLESDVSRAAEQSAEQFRTGIKAFLYSCLVAAVSAVDEHSTSTLEGLVKEAPKETKENGHNGKIAHQFTMPGETPKEGEEN